MVKKIRRYLKYFTRKLQACFKQVSMMFQGCVKGGSSVLQRFFQEKGVSRDF